MLGCKAEVGWERSAQRQQNNACDASLPASREKRAPRESAWRSQHDASTQQNRVSFLAMYYVAILIDRAVGGTASYVGFIDSCYSKYLHVLPGSGAPRLRTALWTTSLEINSLRMHQQTSWRRELGLEFSSCDLSISPHNQAAAPAELLSACDRLQNVFLLLGRW